MKISIKDMIYQRGEFDLELTSLTDDTGFDRIIQYADINRPGLCLAGAFEHFAHDRIQVFGKGESSYLKSLTPEQRKRITEEFFSFGVFCCIFPQGIKPPADFLEVSLRE